LSRLSPISLSSLCLCHSPPVFCMSRHSSLFPTFLVLAAVSARMDGLPPSQPGDAHWSLTRPSSCVQDKFLTFPFWQFVKRYCSSAHLLNKYVSPYSGPRRMPQWKACTRVLPASAMVFSAEKQQQRSKLKSWASSLSLAPSSCLILSQVN
jgi:hypothetical protein